MLKLYNITLSQITEEIEKDKNIFLDTKPIFESPIQHESEFFGHLNDIRTNNPFALQIMDNLNFVENVEVNDRVYKLYRNIENLSITDYFISGKEGHETLSAFVKYKSENHIIKIEGLWQIEYVIGLVRGLIDEYYPKIFSVLESSAITNQKGKSFYQRLAKDYLQMGRNVVVSMNGKDIPYKIENADSYWKNSSGVMNFEKKLKFNLK